MTNVERERNAAPSYGEQTKLALENFPDCGRRVRDVPDFVRSYALVKAACAKANVELGVLDSERGRAVERAARSVAALEHLAAFPIPLIQGGGGTSTNMNMNEVIAVLATELLDDDGSGTQSAEAIHPNDHVNASQSTNDTYPTAMALTLMDIAQPTLAAFDLLRLALLEQARRGRAIRRLGRTCLQDAVTLTIEDTHGAHATLVETCSDNLRRSLSRLSAVPLGGTVLGTGVGAPEGFAQLAVKWLTVLSERELTVPGNIFAAMAHLDTYASVADACKQSAMVLARIAADLRWLAAGPVGGPGEVVLPVLQAGSSIMPGKINPIVPELVMQFSFRVRGAAHTVDLAVASGELELNVMEPVIFDSLLSCLEALRLSAEFFAEKCVSGLEWNRGAVEHSLDGALDAYVHLARSAGYATATADLRRRSAPDSGTTAPPPDRQGHRGFEPHT